MTFGLQMPAYTYVHIKIHTYVRICVFITEHIIYLLKDIQKCRVDLMVNHERYAESHRYIIII